MKEFHLPRFIGRIVCVGALLAAPAWAAPTMTSNPASLPEPLDIETAIRYALDHNYSIRLARESIKEQEGLITEVKARVLPNAAIVGSYSKNADELSSDRAGLGSIGSTQSWNIALQVTQLLYSGGGVSAALDAQRLVRESALLNLQATVNGALLEVRTRFYDVLLARDQIDVQDQNVQLLREQLQTAKDRYEAGSVSQFDVLRAEVELANAQPALIRARNAFRNGVESLRQSLGYQSGASSDWDQVPTLVGELEYQPVSYDLRNSINTARESRPELQQLLKIAEAREAGIKIAKSNYLPNLALVGGYELRKSGFSDRFAESLDGWTVGLQSSWAIFDGRATSGKVVQAKSQLEQAKLQAESYELGIEVEVRRAVSALQEAQELADAAGKTVEQAEEALRLANVRYGAGSSTQLEQLQARVALTQARDNQLQANYSYNVAVARLRQATGLGDILVVETY